MAVYVDELREYPKLPWPNGNRACHMVADTPEELHGMALRIGMPTKWAQIDRSDGWAHYDLSPNKRALAVKAGAVEVTSRDIVRMRRAARKAG